MASTRDDRLAEMQIAEELSHLAREEGDSPSAQPTSVAASRAQPATNHPSAKRRHVAFSCSLLAASIGVVAWWWSPSAHPAMTAPHPAPLTQGPREAASPKDAALSAIIALSSDLAPQLQSMTRDLAALSQAVEQLKVRQEQLVRDNENVASQLKASQEEIARNNRIADETRAIQSQMARESQTLTERLNASQAQLADVIANASAPNVTPEGTKVSPEEPRVMPEIPLPRPRQSANVAQAPKPASTAPLQVKKPQPLLSWPWSR